MFTASHEANQQFELGDKRHELLKPCLHSAEFPVPIH